MTNNNDLLNGKVYKQDNIHTLKRELYVYVVLLFYIMVRHNHLTYIYETIVRSLNFLFFND